MSRSIYTDEKSIRSRLNNVLDEIRPLEEKVKSDIKLDIPDKLKYQRLVERREALVQILYGKY